MLRAEIEELRPLLQQHQEQRQKLLEELKDARDAEQEAKRILEQSRLTQQEKRRRLRKTLQQAVAKVIIEQRATKALTTPSPELHVLEAKLNEDLRGLRHKIHGLKYSQSDQTRGSVKIQSWWRCILAQRVHQMLRISNSIWSLKNKMAKASVTIQRWFRAFVVRVKWKNVVEVAAQRRRKFLEERLEHQTKAVKLLQRAVRMFLAKRRLARSQDAGVELGVEDNPEGRSTTKYVDNWRPASERREVRDAKPPEDLELVKMKDAGLIPFYSRTSNTIRHRIGGPFALKIQMQLGIGVGRSTSPPPMAPLAADGPPKEAEMVLDATEAQEEPSSTVDVQKPQRESVKLPPAVVKIVGENIGLEDELGGHWEIYPDGLSQGFLKSMTYDYHSLTKRPGQPPPSTANVPTKVKRSRPRSTKTLEVGPLLTQRRAERREQQQQEESAAMIKAENIKAVAHLQHPLLEGLLPNVPMHVKPSPPAAPPGRPRPNFGCGSFTREECSWSDATSFYSRRCEKITDGGWRQM